MRDDLGATVVTPWFVLLHVPKTGGTFLRAALRRELPAECFVPMPQRSHVFWAELPPEAQGVPALAFVRNPWEWYVSRYHYLRQTKVELRDPILLTETFAEQVQRSCGPDGDRFTQLFDYITAGAPLTIGRYERLVEDTVAFLAGTDAPIAAGLEQRMRDAPRLRVSAHDDHRTYYTPELRDRVGTHCAMVERHGYTF